MLRFAYWSIDEVNRDLAERLAARARIHLELLDFRDDAPGMPCDAVLYDLDSFPADARRLLLADLRSGRPTQPVAIHTYRIAARRARVLRRRGAIVAKRLRLGLFVALRASIAEHSARQSATRAAITP